MHFYNARKVVQNTMEALFPFDASWGWGTFILYVCVALFVSKLCQIASKADYYAQLNSRRSVTVAKAYRLIAWIILVLLATLRSQAVGPDTSFYVDFFGNLTSNPSIEVLQRWEPGFVWLMRCVRILTSNYSVLLFIIYAFHSYAIVRFISFAFKHDSDYIFLQPFIFYFVNNMSAMRSAVAVSFLLLSWIALSNDKKTCAICLTACAGIFHYTALYNLYILALVIAFESRKVFKKRKVWVASILTIIGATYFLANFVQQLFAGTRYNFYAKVDIADRSLLGSVFVIAFFVLCIANYKNLQSEITKYPELKTVLFIALGFMVSYPIVYITGAFRITYYYSLPRFAIWSRLTNYYKRKLSKNSQKVIIIAEQFVMILYLLFLFTRFANNGAFKYVLRIME